MTGDLVFGLSCRELGEVGAFVLNEPLSPFTYGCKDDADPYNRGELAVRALHIVDGDVYVHKGRVRGDEAETIVGEGHLGAIGNLCRFGLEKPLSWRLGLAGIHPWAEPASHLPPRWTP